MTEKILYKNLIFEKKSLRILAYKYEAKWGFFTPDSNQLSVNYPLPIYYYVSEFSCSLKNHT